MEYCKVCISANSMPNSIIFTTSLKYFYTCENSYVITYICVLINAIFWKILKWYSSCTWLNDPLSFFLPGFLFPNYTCNESFVWDKHFSKAFTYYFIQSLQQSGIGSIATSIHRWNTENDLSCYPKHSNDYQSWDMNLNLSFPVHNI